MNLLLTACNSSSDSAHAGCLLGILPDFFGCNQQAIINFLWVLFDNLTPNLPKNSFGTHISNWYSFQEFFGLHLAFLQHSLKKSTTFFICCFCDEAWAILLTTAKTTGPINIHGCMTNILEFPPDEKKTQYHCKTKLTTQGFQGLTCSPYGSSPAC
jgi:hypothetical protein